VAAHGTLTTVCTMEYTNLMTTQLQDFDNVFTIPTKLPPPCHHNNQIHLQPDTTLIAVWPYRYPQLVKDELERQC
jgi:hypothetical protein